MVMESDEIRPTEQPGLQIQGSEIIDCLKQLIGDLQVENAILKLTVKKLQE
jgi:hypothetical protein